MDSTTADPDPSSEPEGNTSREAPCLVLAWSEGGVARAGELLRVPRAAGAWMFGRGGAAGGDPRRLSLLRQRPGGVEPRPPIDAAQLSREQLALRPMDDAIAVENRGRAALLVNGTRVDEARVRVGDVVTIASVAVFYCASRPVDLPVLRAFSADDVPAFGRADRFGFVGESPATWALRDRVAFMARRQGHVLVSGPSGAGKELVARALHAMSSRASRNLVARNAATLPAGLVDAELFGNARSYPNAGMPERAGLIGEAHGGTLFLDEIGELPVETQTHLLRVLDAGGEYQRLGESGRRTADIRLIGATNRDKGALRGDVLARFPHRLEVGGVEARIEDAPLLLRHLLLRAARSDAEIEARFVRGADGGDVRVDAKLIEGLLRHRFTTHARELEAILWAAVADADGDEIRFSRGARELLGATPSTDSSARAAELPSREAVVTALRRARGVREKAWRDLGLANRYVLKRLLQKYGIATGEADEPEP